MTSLKSFNHRVGSLFAVAALVLATVTPGLIPAFASAAQLTERSVELTSSSKAADNVEYTIKFTPSAAAKAVVLNFCSNSPLIGDTCTVPAGFDALSATATGFTVSSTTAASSADPAENNAVVLTGAVSATPTTIVLVGVTNPTDAGPLYLRIVTYDGTDASQATTRAQAYVPATLGAGVVDQGTAAISITDSIGVSAAVRESMTFCVSGAEITEVDCGSTTPPTVKLGQGTGELLALDSTHVSTGDIYAQISTNAATGAVVNLKSTAAGCGGLVRAGATNCDIGPALAAGIEEGDALFGVKVATADDPDDGDSSAGTFGAFNSGAYYSDSVFKLNFVEQDASGITSPYGDSFLDTAGAPANNKNVKLTFGASVANNTPAGTYSTNLSLIATGKF